MITLRYFAHGGYVMVLLIDLTNMVLKYLIQVYSVSLLNVLQDFDHSTYSQSAQLMFLSNSNYRFSMFQYKKSLNTNIFQPNFLNFVVCLRQKIKKNIST